MDKKQMKTKMQEILNECLEVYYVKDTQLNKKREEDKRKTIDWIISGILEGPQMCGVQASSTSNPEYTWTFGSGVWKGEQRCILIRDPICRMCGIRSSVEVHHIRPKYLQGNPEHPRNLIGLCMECHDEVHRRINAGIQTAITGSIPKFHVY